jgi:hypothetical protein
LNKKPGTLTSNQIQRLIQKWESPNVAGQLPEYCDVAIYLLRKRLRRAQ